MDTTIIGRSPLETFVPSGYIAAHGIQPRFKVELDDLSCARRLYSIRKPHWAWPIKAPHPIILYIFCSPARQELLPSIEASRQPASHMCVYPEASRKSSTPRQHCYAHSLRLVVSQCPRCAYTRRLLASHQHSYAHSLRLVVSQRHTFAYPRRLLANHQGAQWLQTATQVRMRADLVRNRNSAGDLEQY